jgi:hypothetical protein
VVLVHDDDLGFIKGLGDDDTVSQSTTVSFASRLSLPCHKCLETLQADVLKGRLRSLKPDIQQVLCGEWLLNHDYRLRSQKKDHIASDENGPDTNTMALTVVMLSKEPRRSTFYFSCNRSISLLNLSFATDIGTSPEPPVEPSLTTAPRAHTPNISDSGEIMDISIPVEASPEARTDIAILPVISTSDPSQVTDMRRLPPVVSRAPDTR